MNLSDIKTTRVIKTDFATISLSLVAPGETVKIKKIDDIPFKFFNLTNPKGQNYAIGMSVVSFGEVAIGYRFDQLASTVESTLDQIRQDVNEKLIKETSADGYIQPEDDIATLNFSYDYPHGHSRDIEKEGDSHKPILEELLRGVVRFAATRNTWRYRQHRHYGWIATSDGAQFSIHAEALGATLFLPTEEGYTCEIDKKYSLTARLDSHEGVLSLKLFQMDQQSRAFNVTPPLPRPNLAIFDSFWVNVLEELNKGLVEYNKLPGLPEALKVRELSSINTDKMKYESGEQIDGEHANIAAFDELFSQFTGRFA